MKNTTPFAIWLTGLPACGKSTIAAALVAGLGEYGVNPVVLESDALRKVLTPKPTYSDEERDAFYRAMVYIGGMFIDHGVPVIFDATANRRAYRDAARQGIERFIEVYVHTPLSVCEQRDPKGIYRAARGDTGNVPGVHAPYELPRAPEISVSGSGADAKQSANEIISLLVTRHWV